MPKYAEVVQDISFCGLGFFTRPLHAGSRSSLESAHPGIRKTACLQLRHRSEEFKTLTKEECYALENHLSEIDPLLGPSDRDIVGVEVGKLANGIVEQPVRDFIEKRTEAAVDTRVDQREHVAARKELREKLKAISQPDLAAWLKTETMSPYGIEVFYQHLKKMHGNGPKREYARDVLLSATAHAARALVRADLYSNWRAGTRGSNPADLVDDMLHVLQAIYSDFYVTGENNKPNMPASCLPRGRRWQSMTSKHPSTNGS